VVISAKSKSINSHVSTQKWEMPKAPIVHQLPLLISIKHLETRHSSKLGWKRVKRFEMASRFDTPDIPVIDFSLFLHGSARDRAQVASSIDMAFKSCGFMHLRNHGIDQHKVDECF
jgi:hypothetical protein